MPAPSPSTKPSRFRSKGRLAVSASSLRESAREAAKAATDMRVTEASAPPATIATASPRRITSSAVPSASAPEAQADIVL